MEQLLDEGVIQIFYLVDSPQKIPLLGAVGQLQFEVVQYRLQSEYGVESRLETASFTQIRWFVPGMTAQQFQDDYLGTGVRLAKDLEGELVILFPSDWSMAHFIEKHPNLELHQVSSTQVHAEKASLLSDAL